MRGHSPIAKHQLINGRWVGKIAGRNSDRGDWFGQASSMNAESNWKRPRVVGSRECSWLRVFARRALLCKGTVSDKTGGPARHPNWVIEAHATRAGRWTSFFWEGCHLGCIAAGAMQPDTNQQAQHGEGHFIKQLAFSRKRQGREGQRHQGTGPAWRRR